MAIESGPKKPNLTNLLSGVFTAVILTAGVIAVFTDVFGFNLDKFADSTGDARDFFPPLHAKTQEKEYYKFYDNIEFLNTASEVMDTNDATSFHKMVECYRVNRAIIPKIYSDLDKYNKLVAIWVVGIAAVWISSIWVIRWSIFSRVEQAKASEELQKTVDGLKTEIKASKASDELQKTVDGLKTEMVRMKEQLEQSQKRKPRR